MLYPLITNIALVQLLRTGGILPRVVIAVTGMPGSGKSIVAKVIADSLGVPVYSMGDVVRREVVKRGLQLNVENVEMIATKLREELGKAAVAILLSREIDRIDGFIVIDGLRSTEEARILARDSKLCIVAVHASPYTRFRRLIARGRVDEVTGWDDFMLRDKKNLEYGIGEAIALADYMIVNEGSIEEARRQAVRVAGRIKRDQGKSCSGGGVSSYGGSREG